MATRTEKAKAAGRRVANENLSSDMSLDWIHDQLQEGKKLSGRGEAAPGLETEDLVHLRNATELARRLLQQIGWDVARDTGNDEIVSGLKEAKLHDPSAAEKRAFMEGVRAVYASPQARSWLAEVIQQWAEDQKKTSARHGDRRSSRAPRAAARRRSSRSSRRRSR